MPQSSLGHPIDGDISKSLGEGPGPDLDTWPDDAKFGRLICAAEIADHHACTVQ